MSSEDRWILGSVVLLICLPFALSLWSWLRAIRQSGTTQPPKASFFAIDPTLSAAVLGFFGVFAGGSYVLHAIGGSDLLDKYANTVTAVALGFAGGAVPAAIAWINRRHNNQQGDSGS